MKLSAHTCMGPDTAERLSPSIFKALSALLFLSLLAGAPEVFAALEPCRIKGVSREVQCGKLQRAQNPDEPGGRKITLHYALIPALAKDKAPDPLFVFAGGPGQSAIAMAHHFLATQALLGTRRDLVFIDQRGTGRSNALSCPQTSLSEPLQSSFNPARRLERLSRCIQTLIEQGNDPRQYATWIAAQDIDAVRAALGAEHINLWAASYGTRLALEYLRGHPQRVRAAVLDGAVTPQSVLPESFALDNEAALIRLSEQCEQDTACNTHYPHLVETVDKLLARAERGQLRFKLTHPITGAQETLQPDPMALMSAIRSALYLPTLTTELPYALTQAAQGDGQALITLSHTLAGPSAEIAEVMHFSVICAEDMPRLKKQSATQSRFAPPVISLYQRVCTEIPVRAVPDAFFSVLSTQTPILILSGGADPATPPRHGHALSQHLKGATHLIAQNLGHGVSSSGCAPKLLHQFLDQASAANLDASCLANIPAPSFFFMPGALAP